MAYDKWIEGEIARHTELILLDPNKLYAIIGRAD